jgi:HEAT repeat protein
MKHFFTTLFLTTALAAQAGIPGDVLTNLSSPDLAKRFEAETKLRQLAFETGKPGADPATAASLEKDLLSLAADTKAPEASRLSALEQLPFCGSASSVSGLAALLADPTPIIRENARCALQNNPAPAASVPLLQALEKADQPAWTLGLMDSLATRADVTAIPAFASRLTSPNPAIASLAAQSLGSIGSNESFEALNKFLPNCPPNILPVAQSALVRCALPLTKDPTGFWGRLVAAAEKFIGMPTPAESISALWPKAINAAVRCEIFNALASIGDGSQAAPIMSDLLTKQDTPGTREILRMAVLSGNPSLKDPVLVALPNLNEDARLSVHAALAEKSDTSREDDLLALAAALDGSKRASAIEMLASCGTEKSLEFLVAEVGKKSPQTLPSASLALNRLKIAGLDQRLIEQAKSKPDEKTITLLSMRNPEGTEALFLKLAAPDSPADLNKIVLSSLETVGGYDTGVQLINWIAQAPEGSDSKPYVATFRRLAPRLKAESVLWKSTFLPAFESATMENRTALLQTIPGLRCPESGATLVEWIRSDSAMRQDGIDQLLGWSSFDAGNALLDAAVLPNLDAAEREKFFQAATKLFSPSFNAPPYLKAAYAKRVLAAAPEGPIRDSIAQSMTDANIPK